MADTLTQSYNSFSGVDITAVFGSRIIGAIQGISYSVTREKAPIYTMGSADPRAFSRGKRGIAGSLIFTMFDRSALLDEMTSEGGENLKFAADKSDPRPSSSDVSSRTLTAAQLAANVEQELSEVGGDKEWVAPWYTDQIPPFDITLSAANEYGAVAVMRIYGVEVLNEGYGISIDDIVSEQQYTYVCRAISPWNNVGVSGGATETVSGT